MSYDPRPDKGRDESHPSSQHPKIEERGKVAICVTHKWTRKRTHGRWPTPHPPAARRLEDETRSERTLVDHPPYTFYRTLNSHLRGIRTQRVLQIWQCDRDFNIDQQRMDERKESTRPRSLWHHPWPHTLTDRNLKSNKRKSERGSTQVLFNTKNSSRKSNNYQKGRKCKIHLCLEDVNQIFHYSFGRSLYNHLKKYTNVILYS